MSRTKTGRCRANRRTRREKEGYGAEIEKAGNDIKEKEGKKREAEKKKWRPSVCRCTTSHPLQ
jgi:uncharacterized protein YegL